VFLDLGKEFTAAIQDVVIGGEDFFGQWPYMHVVLDYGQEFTADNTDLVIGGEGQVDHFPDVVPDFGQEFTAANPDGLGIDNDFVQKLCHLTLKPYNPGVDLVRYELEFVITNLKICRINNIIRHEKSK
jgi:hypothetical protein